MALKDIDLMTKRDHLHECVAHSTHYRFDYMDMIVCVFESPSYLSDNALAFTSAETN